MTCVADDPSVCASVRGGSKGGHAPFVGELMQLMRDEYGGQEGEWLHLRVVCGLGSATLVRAVVATLPPPSRATLTGPAADQRDRALLLCLDRLLARSDAAQLDDVLRTLLGRVPPAGARLEWHTRRAQYGEAWHVWRLALQAIKEPSEATSCLRWLPDLLQEPQLTEAAFCKRALTPLLALMPPPTAAAGDEGWCFTVLIDALAARRWMHALRLLVQIVRCPRVVARRLAACGLPFLAAKMLHQLVPDLHPRDFGAAPLVGADTLFRDWLPLWLPSGLRPEDVPALVQRCLDMADAPSLDTVLRAFRQHEKAGLPVRWRQPWAYQRIPEDCVLPWCTHLDPVSHSLSGRCPKWSEETEVRCRLAGVPYYDFGIVVSTAAITYTRTLLSALHASLALLPHPLVTLVVRYW